MKITCEKCGLKYHDEIQLTYCPHERFISDSAARMKDLAFSLMGKQLVFAHQPRGMQPTRITSMNSKGMVTLDGWDGEFSPHLLMVAK